MDMPNVIYLSGIEQRHLGGREGRWTEWIPADGEITKYVCTDIAQSLADALEHLLVTDRYEAIAQARAALKKYRGE